MPSGTLTRIRRCTTSCDVGADVRHAKTSCHHRFAAESRTGVIYRGKSRPRSGAHARYWAYRSSTRPRRIVCGKPCHATRRILAQPRAPSGGGDPSCFASGPNSTRTSRALNRTSSSSSSDDDDDVERLSSIEVEFSVGHAPPTGCPQLQHNSLRHTRLVHLRESASRI